ncbi:hypothetical protein RFI_35083 [Reticulomyxa filosa]|uniref:Uncharacterized protein n=1 Tax=Reticulomyxa filosa TaxID=46433 RepID=X6LK85_RETFI|nr:hypothetical protein RFI_35083 [Reticulomyxa filosa]|eukprot:ETO02353.1 hypothetical protein RFI_35083 [Reticulomyxa filosa]
MPNLILSLFFIGFFQAAKLIPLIINPVQVVGLPEGFTTLLVSDVIGEYLYLLVQFAFVYSLLYVALSQAKEESKQKFLSKVGALDGIAYMIGIALVMNGNGMHAVANSADRFFNKNRTWAELSVSNRFVHLSHEVMSHHFEIFGMNNNKFKKKKKKKNDL